MHTNLVSTLTAMAILSFSVSVTSAQDKFDYTELISKDGSVEGATKIDIAKAYELHNEGVLFVDVNTPLRYKFAHIPGAVGLDYRIALTEENLAKHAKTKDQAIVFYCPKVGCYVAAQASAKAITWGYTNVMILEGGAAAWSDAGYPVEGQ